MDNPGLPDNLWTQLSGGLWHATNRSGLQGIITDNEIKTELENRYPGSFSLYQNGISLFDLGPSAEDVPDQFHHWCGWFGHHQQTRIAIWLEIGRARVGESLLDAKTAREVWRESMYQTFIPGVEACHRGPIPADAIEGALLIDQYNRSLFHRLHRLNENSLQEIDKFEATLPAHQDDPIVGALLAGRRRTHD